MDIINIQQKDTENRLRRAEAGGESILCGKGPEVPGQTN